MHLNYFVLRALLVDTLTGLVNVVILVYNYTGRPRMQQQSGFLVSSSSFFSQSEHIWN